MAPENFFRGLVIYQRELDIHLKFEPSQTEESNNNAVAVVGHGIPVNIPIFSR